MAATLPIEIFKILEDKLGRDEAVKVTSAIELSLETIENKAKDTALQKKLELKDELTKELASKGDVLQAKTELRAEIQQTKAELRAEIQQAKHESKTETQQAKHESRLQFFIILFAIILNSPKAIEFIIKLLGFAK